MKTKIEGTFTGLRRAKAGADGRTLGAIVTVQVSTLHPETELEFHVDGKLAEKIATRFQSPVSIVLDFGGED